jgi:hypothetical protein
MPDWWCLSSDRLRFCGDAIRAAIAVTLLFFLSFFVLIFSFFYSWSPHHAGLVLVI